ncbi:protein phosphatase 1k, mitochondrial-like [Plakobranchus ocellatus]|uniref:Protein phosphatase 1k, mitochondrial-like n=1 Tax=Plakobranchus ocellatus TaxID=259542 RepID=A0AAV4BGY1_9GAST|nr:protein phosphatase 1k, mitochondrial-like [Plakobranchus ocellatus]
MSLHHLHKLWLMQHGFWISKSSHIYQIFSKGIPISFKLKKSQGNQSLRFRSDSTRNRSKPVNARGVNLDTIGSWNNRLTLPISYDQSIKKGKIIPRVPLDEIHATSVIGRRKVNEDRYVIEELGPELLFFGMFDGHGGAFAVDFISIYMIDPISFWMTQTTNLSTVLQNSFCDLQNLLARHMAFYHLDSEMFKTGTTATVCLLRNSTELVIGHVGDSLAVLCRDGKAVRLSVDHDPEDSDESCRIIEKGGKILCNSQGIAHVNGRLAMTRSFGDLELKSYGVTATPFIKSVEVKHGHDAFLVLSSDGLSFAISDQEIVDIVNKCHNPEEACSRLADQAQHFGSEDNVTVMVIPLGAWGKFEALPSNSSFSFGRVLSHSKNY